MTKTKIEMSKTQRAALRAAVKALDAERAAAERAHERALRRVIAAAEVGTPMSALAEAMGWHRSRAYQLLDEARERFGDERTTSST